MRSPAADRGRQPNRRDLLRSTRSRAGVAVWGDWLDGDAPRQVHRVSPDGSSICECYWAVALTELAWVWPLADPMWQPGEATQARRRAHAQPSHTSPVGLVD
jgi:hypothetical protein